MKHGDSTKINKLSRLHLEYVQTRDELSEKLIEIKLLRKKLDKLDKMLFAVTKK